MRKCRCERVWVHAEPRLLATPRTQGRGLPEGLNLLHSLHLCEHRLLQLLDLERQPLLCLHQVFLGRLERLLQLIDVRLLQRGLRLDDGLGLELRSARHRLHKRRLLRLGGGDGLLHGRL